MGTMIRFQRPDGQQLDGYLSQSAAHGGAPGLVIIQEWWGLNDQIKGVADRIASLGYRALVPDLYHGQLTVEEKEAQHLMHDLNFGDAASQDIRGAVQMLKDSGSPKVGITGFCMGGALTLLGVASVPEADLGIVWYGCPPLEYLDTSKIHVPLQGHWGIQDSVFPITQVQALEQKLRAAGVSFEFHRYDAKHAFANEMADAMHLSYLKHDPAAAQLAWSRTVEFLRKNLDQPAAADRPKG
jgi:carboxymethylenebutenolidase